MLDNRVLILGWNYGRKEEVPSWRPYEDDKPEPVHVEASADLPELPFQI